MDELVIVTAVQVVRLPALGFACGDVLRCEVCGGFARSGFRRVPEMPVLQTLSDGTNRLVCLRCQTVRA